MAPTIRNLIAKDRPVFRKGRANLIRVAAGLVATLAALAPGAESPPKASPISSAGTVEEFPPVATRYVRMTILKTSAGKPMLDEVEVFTAETEPRNVALAANGGRASGAGPSDRTHEIEHINDGRYGPKSSWMCDNATNAWLQIDLAKEEVINRIVWSRERGQENRTPDLWNGTPTDYRFEVAVQPGQWHLVASSQDHAPFPELGEFLPRPPPIEAPATPLTEVEAADTTHTPSEYNADHWGEDNEVLQSTINSIAQTPDGYLWIATDSGLARFDGAQFKVFTRENTPAIATVGTDHLLVDGQGRLWFQLRYLTKPNNLVFYDHGRFARPDTGGHQVRRLFTDKEGQLWGYTDAGALRWENGRFDEASAVKDLNSRDIFFVASDRGSNVWVSGSAGVEKFAHGQFAPPLDKEGRALELNTRNSPPTLIPRPDGSAWIIEECLIVGLPVGPNRWRLLGADGTLTEPKAFPWPQPRLKFGSARCDREGNLWICIWDVGLFKLSADGARYQFFAEAEGLTHHAANMTYEDREGNIWVGGRLGGLDRLRKPPFQRVGTAAGVGTENVYSISPAGGGGVWIGTGSDGTFLWKEGKTYLHKGGRHHPWSVMEDRSGVLWVGTYNHGLWRLGAKEWVPIFSREAGDHRYTLSLFEDRSGRVWAGGEYGLSCYDHGGIRSFLPPLFDKGNMEWVNSLAEDGQGAIWVGTKLGLLHRWQEGGFTTFMKSTQDTQFPVCALYFRRPGELWMARFGSGLSRLKDGKLTDYTPAQSLPTSTINGILDDGRGFLWLTSKQGVFRISKTDFDAFSEGKASGADWEHFTKKDGSPSLACQGEQNKPSLCQTADGRIWVPTVQGVGVIDPATLSQAGPPAPAVIESVLLYSTHEPAQTLLAEGEFDAARSAPRAILTIPHAKNSVVIHYTGIDLTDPRVCISNIASRGWTMTGWTPGTTAARSMPRCRQAATSLTSSPSTIAGPSALQPPWRCRCCRLGGRPGPFAPSWVPCSSCLCRSSWGAGSATSTASGRSRPIFHGI